jgi:hypothetical protein
LESGVAFLDTTKFGVRRSDFVLCAGQIDLVGSFYAGAPGASYESATRVVPHAVEVSVEVP